MPVLNLWYLSLHGINDHILYNGPTQSSFRITHGAKCIVWFSADHIHLLSVITLQLGAAFISMLPDSHDILSRENRQKQKHRSMTASIEIHVKSDKHQFHGIFALLLRIGRLFEFSSIIAPSVHKSSMISHSVMYRHPICFGLELLSNSTYYWPSSLSYSLIHFLMTNMSYLSLYLSRSWVWWYTPIIAMHLNQ